MKYVIDGKVYNTKTSTLFADTEFSDGSNRMSNGRARYLYRTAKGAFWVTHSTCWQGERDHAEALTLTEAAESYLLMGGDCDKYTEIFGEALPEA